MASLEADVDRTEPNLLAIGRSYKNVQTVLHPREQLIFDTAPEGGALS